MLKEEISVQETYYIFDYMKRNTGFAVACVSGIVAASSFIISIFSLMYQHILLQPWCISAGEIIPLFKGNLYFSIVVAFICIITLYWTSSAVELWFVQHYKRRAIIIYMREIIKLLTKEIRKQKKAVKQIKRRMRCLKGMEGEKGLRIEIDDLDNEIQSVEKEVKEMWRQTRKTYGYLLFNLFLVLVISSILAFITALVYQTITKEISWSVLLLWIPCFLMIALPARSTAKVINPDTSPKMVKTTVRLILKDEDDKVSRLKEKVASSLDQVKNGIPGKILLSDRKLKEFGYKFIVGLLVLFLTTLISAEADSKKKDTFWMYTEANENYVVAYQNTDLCLLKGAIIDGDLLTIDIAKQLVVTGTIKTHQQTFTQITFVDEYDYSKK